MRRLEDSVVQRTGELTAGASSRNALRKPLCKRVNQRPALDVRSCAGNDDLMRPSRLELAPPALRRSGFRFAMKTCC